MLKNFRLNIILRVLMLTVSIFLLFILIDSDIYYLTPIVLGILIFIQVILLIGYTEKTNKELVAFLQSIRFSDFSMSFKTKTQNASFDRLNQAFNDIVNDFKKIRAEKEEHYFYIHNILQHIEIGILAFQNDGTIELINPSAKKILQLYNIKNIQKIEDKFPELGQAIKIIMPEQSKLIKINDEEEILHLLIFAREFIINNRQIKLISIKNIQSELEEQELDAWQKLIRVLTHEIMNSIAPISSLTQTVKEMIEDTYIKLKNTDDTLYDSETLTDIQSALETIYKRSNGLIHFVETYRNLTKIPKPNFKIFRIKDLLTNIHLLLEQEMIANNISCKIIVAPENIEITADDQLVEQVIINLMKNSIHSLQLKSENRTLEIKAYRNKHEHTIIQVIDNGPGILKDVIDKIFIPFFTTKATGSGIGLSLSKQIMRMHGGNIAVHSEPDIETCFTLNF